MKILVFLVLYFVSSYSFLNGMDESVKQKIEKLRQDYAVLKNEHRKQCYICAINARGYGIVGCSIDDDYCINLRQAITKTILDAGNLVNDQERLNNIWGEDMYSTRKNIIKNMIEEGFNPNDIKYQYRYTPLYEAASFKDIEFGKFLIQHGAEPDETTRKIATPEFLVAITKK